MQLISEQHPLLKRRGIDMWWDMAEINAGDMILEKVNEGLAECDIAIVFLSGNTASGRFAKHELNSIWNSLIKNRKKWILVRLDDVDPSSIYEPLDGYKYIDCRGRADIDVLLEEIEKKKRCGK